MAGYTLGLRCEACGARRSDNSLHWCSACNSSSTVEAATSPWWSEPDGVLARVRGDAEVVREIVRERVDTAEKVARRKVLDELVAEAQELGLYPAPEAVRS